MQKKFTFFLVLTITAIGLYFFRKPLIKESFVERIPNFHLSNSSKTVVTLPQDFKDKTSKKSVIPNEVKKLNVVTTRADGVLQTRPTERVEKKVISLQHPPGLPLPSGILEANYVGPISAFVDFKKVLVDLPAPPGFKVESVGHGGLKRID